MKILLCFFLIAASFHCLRADTPAQNAPPVGIIVLKPVAGYPAAAAWFSTIQWVDQDSGYVMTKDGVKLPFLNDAIGRVIYFDQAYYEEIDHNQYWVDWRISIRNLEAVMPPINATDLWPKDQARLTTEVQILEDSNERYPAGVPLLTPLIATLKEQITDLSNGEVLQNGHWVPANDAVVETSTVPVVGDSEAPVTFTTKDGKTFYNARVTVTDSGLSVLTADGGASVAYERLPDSIAGFPKTARDKIKEWRKKNADAQAAAAAAAPPPPAATPAGPPLTLWGKVVQFFQQVTSETWTYVQSFRSPPPPAASNANPAAKPPSAPIAPPSAGPATAAGPDSSSAVVLIKGDQAEGTGFLTRTASGPVVITNLHVIAGNPNARFLLPNGQEIIPTSMVGASDRDIAMFTIQDNNYKYLDLAANVDQTTAVGDATVIPGDSEGGEVTLKTNGKVVGIGPQRVEFDNPIYHGNSGGPVLDVKTGKVVAVVTGATIMSPTDVVDQNSFANANSAIKGPLRYFGLRLDTVPAWQPYDEAEFVHETLFLKSFHDESRALDSYLNGARAMGVHAGAEDGPPDASFFKTNDKLKKADDAYQGAGRDDAQTAQTSFQELVWNLKSMAESDVGSVENPLNYYPYDQPRAKRELAYRKALIEEIGTMRLQVNDNGSATISGGL